MFNKTSFLVYHSFIQNTLQSYEYLKTFNVLSTKTLNHGQHTFLYNRVLLKL